MKGLVTSGSVLQGCHPDLAEALRIVARNYDGPRGVWAYDMFDTINATFFRGELPQPKIQWAITPHGGCLGLTRSGGALSMIALHPSLLGGTEKPNPWGIDPVWLGELYALDVLIHEATHVAQRYLLGGGERPTSHNNTAWIAEVNRLAPLLGLGLGSVTAGRSRTRRVPVEGATTRTGKPLTRVARASEGDLPHRAVATFPGGLRRYQGTADAYYTADVAVTSDWLLQIVAGGAS
jgi:hypothetical protein